MNDGAFAVASMRPRWARPAAFVIALSGCSTGGGSNAVDAATPDATCGRANGPCIDERGGSGGGGGAEGGVPDAATTSDAGPASDAATGGDEANADTGASDGTARDAGPVTDAGPVEPPCPKPAGQICHEFYATDDSAAVVHYVNEFDPSRNWVSSPVAKGTVSPETMEMVDSTAASHGRALLVSTYSGYAEIDLDDGRVLTQVGSYKKVVGAARFPDGNTVLANDKELFVVDPTGATIRSIDLRPLSFGHPFRAMRRNPANGHFLLSRVEDRPHDPDAGIPTYTNHIIVYELDADGTKLWSVNAAETNEFEGWGVAWRDGGGVYVTLAFLAKLLEIDSSGNVVGQWGALRGKSSTPYGYFFGFSRLSNGHFVVANWFGIQIPLEAGPPIVELDPTNALVWQWSDMTQARLINNVYVVR